MGDREYNFETIDDTLAFLRAVAKEVNKKSLQEAVKDYADDPLKEKFANDIVIPLNHMHQAAEYALQAVSDQRRVAQERGITHRLTAAKRTGYMKTLGGDEYDETPAGKFEALFDSAAIDKIIRAAEEVSGHLDKMREAAGTALTTHWQETAAEGQAELNTQEVAKRRLGKAVKTLQSMEQDLRYAKSSLAIPGPQSDGKDDLGPKALLDMLQTLRNDLGQRQRP